MCRVFFFLYFQKYPSYIAKKEREGEGGREREKERQRQRQRHREKHRERERQRERERVILLTCKITSLVLSGEKGVGVEKGVAHFICKKKQNNNTKTSLGEERNPTTRVKI